MSQVELKNISKSFGAQTIIKNLNLQMGSGKLTVLVGPSGCGKSTILRMIAGLESPSEGQIFLDQKEITHLHPANRQLAMVFQSYALYPHMTIEQNLQFGLKSLKLDKEEKQRRVKKAVEILQIEALLKRKPRQLSGGQRQRVAIGRALVKQPKVFLFDEPLSNLDAALRGHTRVEIAKLRSQLEATMIYVTHDQTEAMTLADQIVVLREGNIEQIGSPLEVYHSPNNVFVARFLGSPGMNIFENDEFQSGIRPERLKLDRRSKEDIEIPVKINVVERLGDHSLAYAQTQNHEEVIAKLSGEPKLVPGTELSFFANPHDRIKFDAKGFRID